MVNFRMLWFTIISAVLLTGVVVIAVIASRRHQRPQTGPGTRPESNVSFTTIDVSTVPDWAPGLSLAQFNEFMRLIEAHFVARDGRLTFDDGWVIREMGEGREPHRYGLTNLAQTCAQSPIEEWPSIIAWHFDYIADEVEHGEADIEVFKSFENARSVLHVRIWAEEALGVFSELDERMPARIDLPGTVTTLVFDLPRTIRSVMRSESDHWNLSDAELFEIALANLRAAGDLPKPECQDIGEGARLYMFVGDSFLVGSIALILEDYPELLGPFGTLVGVPTRHVVIAAPIQNVSAVHVIKQVIPMIDDVSRKGPGTISPHLYWYRDGRYVPLPYQIKESSVAFHPPAEFIEVLNELPER
jgi:hypothetical protein